MIDPLVGKRGYAFTLWGTVISADRENDYAVFRYDYGADAHVWYTAAAKYVETARGMHDEGESCFR